MVKLTDQIQNFCNQVYRFVPQPEPTNWALDHVKIVAHRGCWNQAERLENTMAAFLESLQHNIWAVEFDLRWTKDNVPVIHHDANTQRVFNKNLEIAETEFSQLRSEIAQIPTLMEVIAALGNKKHLMIELKTLCLPEQVKTLHETLKDLTPVEDYHVMSLDLDRFTPLDFIQTKAMVSIARTNIQHIYKQTLERRLGALTGQYLLLTDAMKNSCQQQDILVGTGFPDSKNLFYRETNRGVNWIFTNQAIELAHLKDQDPPTTEPDQ